YLQDDSNQSILLIAKGKLAPLKQQTVPKLELAATVIDARLHEQLRKSPRLIHLPCYLFSDSQITLWRIYNQKKTFDTFIQSQVELIRSLTSDAQWLYIETK